MYCEPWSDEVGKAAFYRQIEEVRQQMGCAVLMVSHDARLADQFDRVIQMADISKTQAGAT